MIFERPFLLVILPLVTLGLGLTFASFQVSLSSHRQVTTPLNEVALIIKTEGAVELSRFHTPRSSILPERDSAQISVFHLDKIQTRLRSKTVISFLDGYELEFSPKSLFVVEQWNPDENTGPIYINLLSGDFRILKEGRPGSLFVVQGGSIFDPTRKPQRSERLLVLKQPSPFDLDQPEKQESTTAAPSAPTPADSIAEPSPQSDELLGTLTNEYIDSAIAKNRDQFVKCQQNAIRQNQASRGQLLVGIAIEPRGVMKDVRVLASDIENPDLHSCVKSVLERTQFRAFQGTEIVRSYPLIFE